MYTTGTLAYMYMYTNYFGFNLQLDNAAKCFAWFWSSYHLI